MAQLHLLGLHKKNKLGKKKLYEKRKTGKDLFPRLLSSARY